MSLRNISLLLGSLISLVLIQIYVISPILSDEVNFEVCGSKHYLRDCYRLDEKQCNIIWESAKNKCFKRHLEEARKEHPGLLEGPVTQACREYEFNKAARFMKSSSKDLACSGMERRIQKYFPPRD